MSRFEKALEVMREALRNVAPEMEPDGSAVAAENLGDTSPIMIYAWGGSARGLRILLGLPLSDPPPVVKPRDASMN